MRWIILVFTTLLLFFSCKKIERVNPVDGIVGVQTSAVQQLDLSSVQIGTTLQTTEEVPYVTQRGVCWSTNPNPTTANDFVAQGSGFGTFQSKISGLAANTTYYFRSFASNEKTTVYGNEVSYTIKAPVLRTKTAVDVSYTSAKVGGELVNDGGLIVSEYGIYWGVFPSISSENSKLIATQKDFYLDVTELENGKTYYYRTFVQTNLGVAYGEELSFNTLGYNTPSLTTKLVTSIGTNTAISGGEITSVGGLAITEKGVCWSTAINPTIADNKTMEGAGTDSYTSKLIGLEDGVTYYVRAYATNSKGTSYGNEVSFTTFASYKPTLTTNSITSISASDAISGGVISSDGGASITAKGICWSTTSNPTISGDKTNDGTGSVSFTSQLSGLLEGTKYYVRAYATNSKGTSYGNELNFTTTEINKPTLTTNTITNISESGAVSGGVISSNGGAPITVKGICWGTSSNPTITGNKTNDGSGSLSFFSQLSGLIEGTKYYVRAYATNYKGTSYGNEVIFTTSVAKPIIEFVNIPAGTFTMGSPSSEAYRGSDEQQHQVTLSAFKMTKNEITFAQYDAFCNATGRTKPDDNGWGRGNRPVMNVTWNDANAFADWMGCRLPNEAEWEYACRAGTTTPFNTGDNLTTNHANYDGNFPYNGNPKGVYLVKTQPVGSYPSNPWGLNDMHGNVWEWCNDWYGDYVKESQTNPTGPNSGSYRVYRGGVWHGGAQICRSSSRYSYPTSGNISLGFRLVAL
jgi:formylglycine-generating enzyme required for sulfatase activity